jgi:hypothetical protein
LINARIRCLGEVKQEYDGDSPHPANRSLVADAKVVLLVKNFPAA